MNTEQQRQWAYVAMCARAAPTALTLAPITQRSKDQAAMPYKFAASTAVQRIGFHPPFGGYPSNSEPAIRLLARAMGVKLVKFDK